MGVVRLLPGIQDDGCTDAEGGVVDQVRDVGVRPEVYGRRIGVLAVFFYDFEFVDTVTVHHHFGDTFAEVFEYGVGVFEGLGNGRPHSSGGRVLRCEHVREVAGDVVFYGGVGAYVHVDGGVVPATEFVDGVEDKVVIPFHRRCYFYRRAEIRGDVGVFVPVNRIDLG